MDSRLPQRSFETPRLLIRAAQDSDAKGLHECFSDPEAMKYWSTPPHTIFAETEQWIRNMTVTPQNGTTDFVIVVRSTGTTIGKCGIWGKGALGDVEIGFIIARKYWRKGLISEALSALLPYYFGELGYERITADVDPRNEASIASLKKRGFEVVGTRERTWEIAGVWVDSVDLAIDRSTWRKRRQR